ncbi:hypothetical protein CVS37_14040 [Burkholderia lata]|nr:hypothetical protein CVS37_14040 [Burkholderia lata]
MSQAPYNHASFALTETRRGRGKQGWRCAAVLERATGLEVEPRSRNDVVKKVVDEMRNTVHNLASLLLKTQRC